MIDVALNFLKDELGRYIFRNRKSDDLIKKKDVITHNVAGLEGGIDDAILKNKVVLTLVNIEEESALKNGSHYVKSFGGGRYMEPPVFLNLYILIAATVGDGGEDAYQFCLNRLSLVVQFFQTKKQFSIANSPFFDDDSISQQQKEELKLNVELYTLTFEQINHLWGSLGGKQVPSVLYKVRLVKIQEQTGMDAPLIEEVQNDLLHKETL